jgi:hypothetical protein
MTALVKSGCSVIFPTPVMEAKEARDRKLSQATIGNVTTGLGGKIL